MHPPRKKQMKTNGQKVGGKDIKLQIHSENNSPHEVIVNALVFPHIIVGSLVLLRQVVKRKRLVKLKDIEKGDDEKLSPSSIGETNGKNDFSPTNGNHLKSKVVVNEEGVEGIEIEEDVTLELVAKVGETIKTRKNLPPISLLERVSRKIGFVPRHTLFLQALSKSEENNYRVDIVVIQWKNLFFSSICEFQLRQKIVNEMKTLHVGQKVFDERNFEVTHLFKKTQSVVSGKVTAQTRFIFRTGSTEYYLLFQISNEMWEYSPDGDIYWEKAINGFLKRLIELWESYKLTHLLRIIFFTRIDYEQFSQSLEREGKFKYGFSKSSFINSFRENGRLDLYKKVNLRGLENWNSVLDKIKREFNEFPGLIKRTLKREMGIEISDIKNILSPSTKSNVFELFNLILNKYSTYNINRHLHHTGQQYIVVSPGMGVFQVQNNLLCKLTRDRVFESGVSIKIVSLSQPPLHYVPLFVYTGVEKYKVPKWIRLFFYSKRKKEKNEEEKDELIMGKKRFVPFCRMPGIQALAESQDFRIEGHPFNSENPENFDQHDDDLFKTANSRVKQEQKKSKKDDYHIDLFEGFDSPQLSYNTPGQQQQMTYGSLYKALGNVSRNENKKDKFIQVKRIVNPFQYESADIVEETRGGKKAQERYGFTNRALRLIRGTEEPEDIENVFSPYWNDFCFPSVMTMGTNYWPHSFGACKRRNYSVFLEKNEDMGQIKINPGKMLFHEVVCQRLQQQFQFLVHEKEDYKRCYKLTLLDQHHLIRYDGDEMVHIDIFQQETKSGNKKNRREVAYPYTYYNFSDILGEFVQKNVVFKLPPKYDWNKLDRVVSGRSSELPSEFLPRIIQFHLIPMVGYKEKMIAQNSKAKKGHFDDISRFQRLLPFFTKLHFKRNSKEDIDVKIITEDNRHEYPNRDAVLDFHSKLIDEKCSKGCVDRFEWIDLFYKKSYAENECFVFQLKWLLSNATTIGNYLKFLCRGAEREGFLMVKTPFFPIDVPEEMKTTEFFQSSLKDKHPFLKLRSFSYYPKLSLPKETYLRFVVLNRICGELGFLSEICPVSNNSKRFINYNGTVILQIEAGNTLLFIDNMYERRTKYNTKEVFLKIKMILESAMTES